jgi:DNA-binding GntR family transcriptional regulator
VIALHSPGHCVQYSVHMLDQLGVAPTRQSLADVAYAKLLEAIVNGQLPSGTELPTVAVAQRLGMSRTPVQEALRRLAGDGLVDWPISREPRVATFERTDFEEIYELRKVLESAAASRAATRMDAATCQALRKRADAIEKAMSKKDWAEQALAFDVDLHDTIAAAAGNARLLTDIRRYRNLMRAFCRITGGRENLEAAFSEHQRIVDALQARSPQKAAAAMTAHVEARLAAVLRELYPEPEARAARRR